MPSLLESWTLPIALLAVTTIASTWHNLVSHHVPDPYLDEVFHVPQAQRYCNSDSSWDPKITTPPGLYLASLLLEPIAGCSTPALRALNVGALCIICVTAYHILRSLHSKSASMLSRNEADRSVMLDAHSALNISLFPPLFFFSGLYYTDVMSTLVVLLSYSVFINRMRGRSRVYNELATFVFGATSLLFRQTNIFWVAVFPAGLAVCERLKVEGASTASVETLSKTAILQKSWTEGFVYDAPVHQATLQDYILIPLSVSLSALRKPFVLIRALLPHVSLVAIFGIFVAWNGGVVLGDKANHIATLHLPQILYFWPYTVFFSFPLLLPLLFAPILRRLPESSPKSVCEHFFVGKTRAAAPRLAAAASFMIFGLAAVHFNTIVHPFTRADNRHYVFYAFRILMRHWAIRYAAVPAYYICAWNVIHVLGLYSQEGMEKKSERNGSITITTKFARQPCQASFVLVWLVTTTLSVVSAPLVEPRYFIVPWIIWRLHVPNISASSPEESERGHRRLPYDMRLVLETVWLLAINMITGYVFLYHGFAWPSEPGKIQRFMY